jgi:hypothetical protein
VTDLTQFHGYRDSVRWRLGPQGVEIEGSGVERTAGAPITVTSVWDTHAEAINRAAQQYDVPCVLIVATICTESGGNADAVRLEPKYKSDEETPNQVSPGLMQTLISTARQAMSATVDRQWLLDPANSITAGTAVIAQQRTQTELDPPLVAAAYNAGGLRYDSSAGNRWKLVQFPIGTSEHCDRFVKWFNDAVAALAGHAVRPTVPYDRLLGPAAQSLAAAGAPAQPEAAKVSGLFPPAPFERVETAQPLVAAAALAAGDTTASAVKLVFPPEPFERMETAQIVSASAASFATVPDTRTSGGSEKISLFPPDPFERLETVQPIPAAAAALGTNGAPATQVSFEDIARKLLAAAAKHKDLGVDLPGDQARRIPCILTKLLDPKADDRAILINVSNDLFRQPRPLTPSEWSLLLSPLRKEMVDFFGQSVRLGASDAVMLTQFRDFYDAQIFRNTHWLLQQELPLGGGGGVPVSTRAIHDWVAQQQDNPHSIYSC